jgi:uncharacterized membrane protein
MAADTIATGGPKKHALLSTASWIALVVGILMTALGAVFIANAQAVANTVAQDQAIIQEIKSDNKDQDALIQTIAQKVSEQTANVNNLTENIRTLTQLVQGHILRDRP